jgi:Flp pilus assembly protein TadG
MHRKSERGAAAVEFALLSIPLFLLLLGSIEFGYALYAKQVVASAAREGARQGIVEQTPKLSAGAIQGIVSGYLNTMGLTGTTTVVVTGAQLAYPGQLTVQVTYQYQALTGLANLVPGLPNPMPITAQTVMVQE